MSRKKKKNSSAPRSMYGGLRVVKGELHGEAQQVHIEFGLKPSDRDGTFGMSFGDAWIPAMIQALTKYERSHGREIL